MLCLIIDDFEYRNIYFMVMLEFLFAFFLSYFFLLLFQAPAPGMGTEMCIEKVIFEI